MKYNLKSFLIVSCRRILRCADHILIDMMTKPVENCALARPCSSTMRMEGDSTLYHCDVEAPHIVEHASAPDADGKRWFWSDGVAQQLEVDKRTGDALAQQTGRSVVGLCRDYLC